VTETQSSDSGGALLHPPRPPLVFRVGVVGHRPDRLGNADLDVLSGVIRSVLGEIRSELIEVREAEADLYGKEPPVLRAISPLAEGTDRIFAEKALELGAELCCVMPFVQEEFEKDFAPDAALEGDSLKRFRSLVERAKRKFELDGCRCDAAAAYGAAGNVVINQSDVLIVVWDGERRGKRGGTEETFDMARSRGLPVVWIDAHAPHCWQVLEAAIPLPQLSADQRLEPDGSKGSVELLRKCVREGLDLPEPSKPSDAASSRSRIDGKGRGEEYEVRRFFEESKPSWTWAVVWRVFRNVAGKRKRSNEKNGRDGETRSNEKSGPSDEDHSKVPFFIKSFVIEPFEEAVMKEWNGDRSTAVGEVINFLRPYYAWTDKLSGIYGDKYRSAFISSYILAALAVGMALLPVAACLPSPHPTETLFIGVELIMILMILGLIFRGRKLRWHERWIDYRIAAELVRHLRLVASLGGKRPFPQLPAHWGTYGQPGANWMAWYVRGVERFLGLPSAVVNRRHLRDCVDDMEFVVGRQVEYHVANAERCHLIEKRSHRWGFILLFTTLVCCGLHLLPVIWPYFRGIVSHEFLNLLTFFCGFLPAVGAALAGIFNQGEFRRMAKRSDAMVQQLGLLLEKIQKLQEEIMGAPEPLDRAFSPQLAASASDIARLLVGEVLDWRVVFLDQPLNPPA